jgi:hypothetical protein
MNDFKKCTVHLSSQIHPSVLCVDNLILIDSVCTSIWHALLFLNIDTVPAINSNDVFDRLRMNCATFSPAPACTSLQLTRVRIKRASPRFFVN